MEIEKRKLIIREIDHWRRSKLLPEQYCDFLMNLYLEDPADKDQEWMGISTARLKESSWMLWFLAFGIFSLICFLVLHFNSFPLPLQIGLATLFVMYCYAWGILKRRKKPLNSFLLLGFGSLFLLFIGPYLMSAYGFLDSLWILGYVGLCSVVWVAVGLIARISPLHFCGWMGLVFFYSWLLQRYTEAPSWLAVQMYWLPISILLAWVGWIMHLRDKSSATILLLVSAVVWFVPELYSLMMTDLSENVVQFSFLGKIMGAGIVLFSLRKKWIEWVV